MSQYIQTQKTQQVVDAWNKKYGIGEPVLVKKDLGEIIQTTTRSKAQVMPSGHAVIWLVGISGCYDLERVAPIKQPKAVDPALGTGAFLNILGNPPYSEMMSPKVKAAFYRRIDIDCACVDASPIACFAIRNNIHDSEVTENGGPCICACHIDPDQDEEE